MIFGSNDVYEPVAAYDVGQYTRNGIISGGSGDHNIVVRGTRFFWVYNPSSPEASGFTGGGKWYCGVANTPLANVSEDVVLEQLRNGGNLNSYFETWQEIVADQEPGTTDYVKDFMNMVGFDCFSTNG